MKQFLPKQVEDVIESLGRLPGVGPKTAERLTFHLLRDTSGKERTLGSALLQLKENLTFCTKCQNITVENPCAICEQVGRDESVVCVVEEPLDVIAIEKIGVFKGLYHVLHGVISPIDGIGPQDLKIQALVDRIKNDSAIKEVIIACNPSLEGEATSTYIQQQLEGLPVTMTRLARGLPMGGDLEYADAKTLSRAIEGRSRF